MGASILLAHEADIDCGDDVEVREWSEDEGRLLLTGDHDFIDKMDLHPIEECDGIIILSENHKPKKALAILRMMTTVIADLVQNVPPEWWYCTKLRVGPQFCRMWKAQDGDIIEIELRPDHRGRLHFKI